MFTIPFFIAKKHVNLRKVKGFINAASIISIITIAIATIATIAILSISNGLYGLINDLFSSYHPDIKIVSKENRLFLDKDLTKKINSIPEINCVVSVLEDDVIAKCGAYQAIAKLKGVSDDFLKCQDIQNHLIDGNFLLNQHGKSYAILGQGVAYKLNINFLDDFYNLTLLYPKNAKALSLDNMYKKKKVSIGGIVSIDRNFNDNYIIVPLDLAKQLMSIELMSIESGVDAIEVYLKEKSQIKKVKKVLANMLPTSFKILDSQELNISLFKAMKVERLYVLIVLSCILSMAALNMFFIVSMLIIKKQNEIKILLMLGIKNQMLKWIFFLDGLLISFLGTSIGAFIGFILCTVYSKSNYFNIALLTKYPIKIYLSNYLYTITFIMIVSAIASYKALYKISPTIKSD
jgi:lipoprotein-releasing system permease protein